MSRGARQAMDALEASKVNLRLGQGITNVLGKWLAQKAEIRDVLLTEHNVTCPEYCYARMHSMNLVVLTHHPEGDAFMRWCETAEGCEEDSLNVLSLEAAHICSFEESKAVFTFDPYILHALADSPMKEAPPSIFRRLPYTGQWVDVQDLQLPHPSGGDGSVIIGFTAVLLVVESASREYREILNLRLVSNRGNKPGPHVCTTTIDLGGTIEEMYQDHPDLADSVSKILPVLAYLCSETPDVRTVRAAGKKRKKKKARKLLPRKPVVHECGFVLGKQLREARASSGGGGGTKRPHMRRAHWHTYWKGPRKGKRTQTIKWIPPTMIAGSAKDLKVTNHKVTDKTRKKHAQHPPSPTGTQHAAHGSSS